MTSVNGALSFDVGCFGDNDIEPVPSGQRNIEAEDSSFHVFVIGSL